MKRIAPALTAALFCIGCDRADEPVDVEPSVANSGSSAGSQPHVAATSSAGAKVSAAYLAGQWCFLHYQAGDERSDEQIDYVFNEDGTLLYQNNPTTPVDRPGVWKLEDGELSVGPSLWVVSTRVHSVDRNRFVLGSEHSQMVFARGACEREAAP